MSAPERIVLTGDLLRIVSDQGLPSQSVNIEWLARLLRVPLELACGLPQAAASWGSAADPAAAIDQAFARQVYAAFGSTPSPQGWAQLYDARDLPPVAEQRFRDLFGGTLVIGFELPPYLTRFFDREGIPWIDISLSPLRFLDDIAFGLRASDRRLLVAAESYAVPESSIALQAGLISAAAAKARVPEPAPRTLLLVLQNAIDRSLVLDGDFVSVLDYLDTLREIARGYDAVLVKPHPMNPQPDGLRRVVSALGDSTVTDANFYALASHRSVQGVAAVSSSCVEEAVHFGCHGHYLRPDLHARPAGSGVTLSDALIIPDLWRDVLFAAGIQVSGRDGFRLPPTHNRFRKQLRNAWGFNELDTDIEVAWAMSAGPGRARRERKLRDWITSAARAFRPRK